MSDLIILILILVNLILIYFINRKKIKKKIFKSKLTQLYLEDFHDIFQTNKISSNLRGPKEEAIIKSFSISPENKIVGMTSEYESWIISTLSKISKNIFEFGTCSGKNTYLMAPNSSEDSKIFLIRLKFE